MCQLRKSLLVGLCICFVTVLFAFAPFNLGETSDFITLYGQIVALHQGVSLYDEGTQAEVISRALQLPSGKINVPPSPYPPWYVFPFFFLGFFSLHVAARMWFSLNFGMLIAGIFLMTGQLPIRTKLLLFLGASLFPPVLGVLMIGQITMVVFLGVGLAYFGIRHQKPVANAISLFLFTLKPHLGILLFPATFVLSLWRAAYPKRMCFWFASFFGAALLISFIVEPGWIGKMMGAFTRWCAVPMNVERDTCSSLSIELSRWLSFENIQTALVGLAAIIIAFSVLLWVLFFGEGQSIEPECYLSLTVVLTLLALPYIRNYDYVLLLAPLIFGIIHGERGIIRILILISYALAYLVTAVASRNLQGHLLWIAAVLPLLPVIKRLRCRQSVR